MTRHGTLAEQLEALRLYASTPDHDPEPLQTTWTTVAANDNNPEDTEGMTVERRWRMKPSIEEIMRHVEEGDVERNSAGQIIRIGRLRFSDGTQTERGHKLTIDGKVVAAQIRMPVGALLGTKDAAESQLGAEEDGQHVTASNHYFADLMKTLPHRYRAGGKRRQGRNYTRAEAITMLEEAKANTDMSKVTVTRYPDGLPCASQKMADVFPGMVKTQRGESGSLAWQDIVTAKADRHAWAASVASLSAKDKETLDTAVGANSFEDVGIAVGQRREYARRKGGRRALIAANDNLMAAIEAYAS
ncbi:hypothetical protein [Rhizobium sp. SG741]|uniref:hypothetical protein n=1 Tax=Rhizobium sp. SG741 TaxID=2587114 RepID=UPI001445ECE3|nr:hypothetical protein [Rhizobium sp. SG741]NKJ03121.1 hypothetical protein [Rhizobium sp. SG741]